MGLVQVGVFVFGLALVFALAVLWRRVGRERQQAEAHRALFQAAPRALVVTDARGALIEHNHAGAAFVGGLAALSAAERAAYVDVLGAVARDGQCRTHVLHVQQPQAMRAVRVEAARVVRAGEPCVVAALEDITDIETAERERAAVLERTSVALRLEGLGRLAGGIAHDFNNVLAALQLQAELLRTTESASERKEILDEMLQAMKQGRQLTRRFLIFGKGSVDTEAVTLDHAVKNAEAVLRRLLRPGVHLEVQCHSEGIAIAIDSAQLDQALMNLVLNAQNAMTTGTIRVRTAPIARADVHGHVILPPPPDGDLVGLWVEDSGSGMSDDVLAHAFEPFFTTQPAGMGNGVGLTVVHRAAHKAQAGIHVVTAPGAGASFLLTFRRLTAQARVHLTPAPDVLVPVRAHVSTPEGNGRPRILVVDDERTVRTALARTLEHAGYQVLLAHDAASALDVVSRIAGIHLLVTDFLMPGMTGAGLIEELRRRGHTFPMVVVSGYIGGAPLPADITLLEKPVEPEALVRIVRQLAPRAPSSPSTPTPSTPTPSSPTPSSPTQTDAKLTVG